MSIFKWLRSGHRLRDHKSRRWLGWRARVEDREFLRNPMSDVPCGARKPTEHNILPEPVHHECRTCLEAIKAILIERYRVMRQPRPKYTQGDLFPELKRKRLKP